MITNYHTHSRWCRHGSGEIEDYIEEAIKHHYTELAITEHVPHKYSFSWIPWEDFPLYDSALNSCIERYSSRLSILKGFECEYYPEELDQYKRFQEMGYEFLILGQHECGNPRTSVFGMTDSSIVSAYAEAVCKGLETGLFKMLAHPDVILTGYKNGMDSCMESALLQVFQCASELKIPVEINANGLRDGRAYPSEEAFLLSKKYPLTYMISADAHHPSYLCDTYVQKAEAFAERLGLPVMTIYQHDK